MDCNTELRVRLAQKMLASNETYFMTKTMRAWIVTNKAIKNGLVQVLVKNGREYWQLTPRGERLVELGRKVKNENNSRLM